MTGLLANFRSDMAWKLCGDAVRQVLEDGRNDFMVFGFAEGRPDAGILSPSMTATDGPDGMLINGVMRTSGLARSMDFLIASVMATPQDGQTELAVVLVVADSKGLTVSGAGAESGQPPMAVPLSEPVSTGGPWGLSGAVIRLRAAYRFQLLE